MDFSINKELTIVIPQKAGESWELDVLANPFGSETDKDLQGDFFDETTEFHEDKLPLIPVVYFHGSDEKGQLMARPEFIGSTVKRWVDQAGVWYRVVLDKSKAYAVRIWEAAQKGLVRASTGGVLATLRKEPNGHIVSWMNGELTLVDLGKTETGYRTSMNLHAVAIPALKACFEINGLELPAEFQEANLQAQAEGVGEGVIPVVATQTGNITRGATIMPENELTLEQITQLLDARDAEKARVAAESAEAEKRLKDAIAAAREEAKQEILDALKAGNRPDIGVPNLILGRDADERKWDHSEPEDHAFAIEMLRSFPAQKARWNEKAALISLARKLEGETGKKDQYRDAQIALFVEMATENVQKANELSYTTQSGYGDEWIGVAWSPNMWEQIRHEGKILRSLPQEEIPNGVENTKFLLDSSNVTWYHVAEATAHNASISKPEPTFTASKMGTDDQSFSLGKLGARSDYSGEMTEDSVIPYARGVRENIQKGGLEAIEDVLINGDTTLTASTNINDVAGTPAGTELFTTLNGFRKLALITNTANARSAGGGFGVEDFLETLKLMGVAGKNAIDRKKVGFIIDANTGWASLLLPEVKNRDTFVRATMEEGELTGLWGAPIINSPFMHNAQPSLLANSAGKIDLDTAGNNLYGAILGVRWDQWKFGWKRRMKVESERDIVSDSYIVVAHMRIGLVYRDTEAAALTYYVDV